MSYRQTRKQSKLPRLPQLLHYKVRDFGEDAWKDVDAASPRAAAETFKKQHPNVKNVQVKRGETSLFY